MINGLKNRKLLCLLALALVAGMSGSCNRTSWQAAGRLVERGNELSSRGLYQEAIIQYRKALQKEPQYGEAEYRLGLAFLQLNNREAAFASFERALELMPGHEDSTIQLANLLLQVHLTDPEQTSALRSRIESLTAQLLVKSPNSFAAQRIQAFLAGAGGRPLEAVRLFQAADQTRPGECDIHTGLVQNMIAAKQTADAERLGRSYLGAHPGCGPLYDVLYSHLLKSGRKAEAESLLESKIAANRSNAFYVAQLAEHYWRLNQPDRMKSVLRQLEENASSIPGAYREAGDFYARIRDWDSAIRVYQKGVSTEGKAKEPEYLKRIASSYLARGDTQNAVQTLERLLAAFPSDAEAIASRAALRLATGQKDEITRAVADLEQAVKRAPEDPRLRFDLARAYLQTQRTAEAIPHLHEVLKRHPRHSGALRELAAYHLQNREIDKADEFAARILELDFSDAGARLIRTAALASQNRYGEARSELKRLLARHPGLAEAELQLAMLSLQEKNYAQAEKGFLDLLKRRPSEIRALKGLTEVHFTKKRPEMAVKVVEKEADARPDSAPVLRLLADTARRAGQPRTATRALQRLTTLNPNDPQPWLELSSVYFEVQDYGQAAAAAQKALDVDPNRAEAWNYLAAAQASNGKPGDAVASYRRAVALEPGNAAYLNNLAYYLLETGTAPGEALNLARQASQRLPGDPRVADTLGLAYLKNGQTAAAIEVFRTLIRKNPSDPVYRLHLAEALLAANDQPGARRELEAALQLNPTGEVAGRIRSLLQAR